MTRAGVGTLGGPWANCRDYWLGWGTDHRVERPVAMFRSGVAFPLFNGVRQAVGDPQDAWVAARDAMDGVPWMWWVGADSPAGLADVLRHHGAVHAVTLPVMTADLDRIVPSPPPAGLTVRDVAPEEVDEWVRTWVPASDIPAEHAAAVARAERARAAPPDTYVRLAGHLEGQLVGSAVLLAAHGVAGVYAVSTVEGFRRRGIGRAMTDAALAAARERGLRSACLQATPQGLPLYRGMGFAQVGEYQAFVMPTRS